MSTLEVSNVSDGTTTVGTEYVVHGSAKAYYSANQENLDSSFNITSGIDHGIGDYSWPLISACEVRVVMAATPRRNGLGFSICQNENRDSASVASVLTYNSSGSSADTRNLGSIFGDLA